MHSGSSLLVVLISLAGLAGCQSSKPTAPKDEHVTTTTTMSGERAFNANAQPTDERGVYSLAFGMDAISQVRIVPQAGDKAEGRLVDAAHWSFDPSTGLLRVAVPVDDAAEIVVVVGTRARPPQVKLPAGVDFDSVRVVVGDRLGVEGKDYTLDRKTGLLKLLGPDTAEAPLRYYVQATLKPDPAHPEATSSVAFGNLGDLEVINRALGTERH
jgi:hypothetical protein